MKVSSSVSAAHDAVSGFVTIRCEDQGRQVSLGSSTISCMRDGVGVAHQIMKDMSMMVSDLKSQAGRVTTLATEIEDRDNHDAGTWRARE